MDIRTATAPKGTRQKKVVPPEITKAEPMQSALNVDLEDEDTSEDYGDAAVAKAMTIIKKEGLTKDDLMVVLDTLITSGSVQWDTEIFGRMKCTFAVAPTWVTDYITEIMYKKMDENKTMSVGLYNNILAEYETAASLTEFNGTHYGYTNKEQFEEVYKRVVSIPYALLSALTKKTVVFNNIILAATSDWLVKNFTKPPQDK